MLAKVANDWASAKALNSTSSWSKVYLSETFIVDLRAELKRDVLLMTGYLLSKNGDALNSQQPKVYFRHELSRSDITATVDVDGMFQARLTKAGAHQLVVMLGYETLTIKKIICAIGG